MKFYPVNFIVAWNAVFSLILNLLIFEKSFSPWMSTTSFPLFRDSKISECTVCIPLSGLVGSKFSRSTAKNLAADFRLPFWYPRISDYPVLDSPILDCLNPDAHLCPRWHTFFTLRTSNGHQKATKKPVCIPRSTQTSHLSMLFCCDLLSLWEFQTTYLWDL